MVFRQFRIPSLLAAAVLLVIACASVLAHAAPNSHAGCGLHSADASRAVGGRLEMAAVPVEFPDAEAPPAQCTEAIDTSPDSPRPSLAAPPPDPRGPPSPSLLSI